MICTQAVLGKTSQSHITTDVQLASQSWYEAPSGAQDKSSQSQNYFMTGGLPPISSS
jgi:hypothetical protein